ncbi:MAG: hypothetical protein IJR14_03905 [Synergistaceae bacterium]|nr:hypothetical protein [Synergistaceae bacterium]
MRKLFDMAVKVGEYEDQHGRTKGRWKNIGVVMDGKDGPFALIEKTFNPAGVPTQDGRESIIVSFFKPKEKDSSWTRGSGEQEQDGEGGYPPSASRDWDPRRDMDDDGSVPF